MAGHYNIQPAEAVDGRLHDLLASLHRDHRLVARHSLVASLPDECDSLVGLGYVLAAAVHVHAGVDYDHLGPFGCHEPRHSLADAPAGAGYDC